MKSKFILALAAGIIGLTASANAAFVNYYATWSGVSFENSASAYASFKLDTDYLSNTQYPNYREYQWITDIDLTVTGAASGNGHFTSADFRNAAFTVNGPDFSPGAVDFSQDLVGQADFFDFNLFAMHNPETQTMSGAPTGSKRNVLAVIPTGGGQEERMQLTSLSAVPEASTSLGLLALGAGGLLTRRRTSRKA